MHLMQITLKNESPQNDKVTARNRAGCAPNQLSFSEHFQFAQARLLSFDTKSNIRIVPRHVRFNVRFIWLSS